MVRRFMSACFAFEDGNVVHKIADLYLRRAMLEFARCFISGSIPGGVLKNNTSAIESRNFCRYRRSFLDCTHESNAKACIGFARVNYEMSRTVGDAIPCASRIRKALSNTSIYGMMDSSTIRNVAFNVAEAVHCAQFVRLNYLQRFYAEMNNEVKAYKETHEHGDDFSVIVDENWLKEAAKTGQIFPVNPMVRPFIDFGRSKRTENTRSCRKNYRSSDSHSPGIFTAQCACKYPKLIGLSVMDECEGISTALSILLSEFKHMPQVCYYDSECNMLKSIAIRTPWVTVLFQTDFIIDLKCDIVTDHESYRFCSMHSTSTAESINQHSKFSKSHV